MVGGKPLSVLDERLGQREEPARCAARCHRGWLVSCTDSEHANPPNFNISIYR